MFKDKKTKLVLSSEVTEEYKILNKLVGDELKKGIRSSEHQTLLKSIKRSIELLRDNPFAGIQIKKSQIPVKYIEKYDANNLWKINLSNFWRMIYTIKGNEIEIISFVLDIIDHNTYNKIFGYKKK